MFQGDTDDEIEITPDNFDMSPFEFTKISQNQDINDATLFNKSGSIASSDYMRSESSSTVSTDVKETKDHFQKPRTDSDTSSQSAISVASVKKKKPRDDIAQKREILYQLDRLKSKGVNIPYNFSMNSNLLEMQSAYDRIVKEREIDSSVHFQRKMLMGFISGVEYLNTRYDPLSVQLDGWSEQVHESINDYDDIFEELHNKYKGAGSNMAPELRLLISLSGSAFMFHLTKRMFGQSNVPDVEEVLRSNPELMKQFQQASAKAYVNGSSFTDTKPMNTRGVSGSKQSQDNSSDIFGMVSNLFGMDTSKKQENVGLNSFMHENINITPDDNNVEMLSISDEEINSIISDAIDMKITSGDKQASKKRTTKNKRVLEI